MSFSLNFSEFSTTVIALNTIVNFFILLHFLHKLLIKCRCTFDTSWSSPTAATSVWLTSWTSHLLRCWSSFSIRLWLLWSCRLACCLHSISKLIRLHFPFCRSVWLLHSSPLPLHFFCCSYSPCASCRFLLALQFQLFLFLGYHSMVGGVVLFSFLVEDLVTNFLVSQQTFRVKRPPAASAAFKVIVRCLELFYHSVCKSFRW